MYMMDKPEIRRVFGHGIEGIWLWVNNPKNKSHTGNLIYQMSRKHEHQIVKLQVEYDQRDILRTSNGEQVRITHRGDIDGWNYHTLDQSVIVERDIPIENIKLLKVYNLVELLQ